MTDWFATREVDGQVWVVERIDNEYQRTQLGNDCWAIYMNDQKLGWFITPVENGFSPEDVMNITVKDKGIPKEIQ